MQIKITMGDHLVPTRMAIIKNKAKYEQECGEWGKANCAQQGYERHCGKQHGGSSRN